MAEDTPQPQKVYLAIDIEKGGDSQSAHPLLAIGVCLGSGGREPRVLEKRTWCLSPFPGQTMCPRCVAEFWSEFPALLERIRAEAVEPLAGLASFDEWLTGLHARYAPASIELLSDNPAYDIGTLDGVLSARGIRTLPVRYLGDGAYRSIGDPSEMVKGQGTKAKVGTWAGARADHDHWPENDAEYIYWQYIGARAVRDQLAAGASLAEIHLPD